MTREVIVDELYEDEGGVYARFGHKGSKYFVETIAPAFSPHPGEVSRSYYPSRMAAVEVFLRLAEVEEIWRDFRERLW